MDFMGDSLADGRTFRTFNLVDDFSREAPTIVVDQSLPGERITRELDAVVAERGVPDMIVIDNGPEFAGKALDAWAYRHGVKLHFIRPGKPTENAYIESFKGKFRDQCLNEHWFVGLDQQHPPLLRDALAPLAPHGQSLRAIQPVDALVVDEDAFPAQQHVQAAPAPPSSTRVKRARLNPGSLNGKVEAGRIEPDRGADQER
jgi:putative transposase